MFLKLLQVAIMLTGKPDEHVCRYFETQRFGGEVGVIALDESVLFQRAHAPKTWWRRNLRAPRQFDVGNSPVRLQLGEDAHVDGIELVMLHGGTFGRD